MYSAVIMLLHRKDSNVVENAWTLGNPVDWMLVDSANMDAVINREKFLEDAMPILQRILPINIVLRMEGLVSFRLLIGIVVVLNLFEK